MTTTISNKPTNAVSVDKKPRVLLAQYGDGYSQRVGDGINIIGEIWDLTFEYADKSIRDTLDSTLTTLAGISYFFWTPPYESTPKKYICEEWNLPLNDYGSYALTAKFQQVFDV